MGIIYHNQKPLFLEHKKRYVLIFNKFMTHKIISKSITEYDTLKEANEEIELIHEFYKNEPRPETYKTPSGFIDYNFDNGSFFWGYVLLDFEEEKIKFGNDGLYGDMDWKKCDKLFLKDYFFRKKDEIPEDYKFSTYDEYSGWLIYRWNKDHYNHLFNQDEQQPKQKSKTQKSDNKVSPPTDEEIIENDFDKKYDKYLLKKYEDRW